MKLFSATVSAIPWNKGALRALNSEKLWNVG